LRANCPFSEFLPAAVLLMMLLVLSVVMAKLRTLAAVAALAWRLATAARNPAVQ